MVPFEAGQAIFVDVVVDWVVVLGVLEDVVVIVEFPEAAATLAPLLVVSDVLIDVVTVAEDVVPFDITPVAVFPEFAKP